MKVISALQIFVYFILMEEVPATEYFKIGALFHEDETNLAIAFKYAIQRWNLFHQDVKFLPDVHTVGKSDTFLTKKILCNVTDSDDGIVAIFGPTSPKTSSVASSIAETLEIPHIQIQWKPPRPKLSHMSLNYYPDSATLAEGVALLAKNMKWKKYVIIYENYDSLVRLEGVLKLKNLEGSPVKLYELDRNGDYRLIFKHLKAARINNIILDCSTDKLLTVLTHAKEVGMLEYVNSYLLTNLDSHTIDIKSLDVSANITTVRIIDPERRDLHNVVSDWHIGESNHNRLVNLEPRTVRTEVALMEDAVTHFTETFSSLHITLKFKSHRLSCERNHIWPGGYAIPQFMQKHPLINGLSGNVSFDDSGYRNDFILRVVEYANNAQEQTCIWYPNSPFRHMLNCTRSDTKVMEINVQKFQNTTVIVSSRIGPPYLIYRQPKYVGEILEGNARYEGYSMDLIDAIAKELNFTYKFVLTADGKYGNYDKETQSWNGLVKDLLDRKAHLAICDLTITKDRREVVDFSSSFMQLGISILYKKAEEGEINLFAFMSPLESEVWIYITTFYISVTFAIFLISRMAPDDWESPHPCDENPEELENIWTLKNSSWLILGSMMSQGCDILPKGISSRMAISMWWFFILIINSSYTANLAAFLAIEKMGTSINSAEDLAKQTRIKYGTVDGGATQAFFRDSSNPIYQRIYSQMKNSRSNVFEKSNADGVKRVLTAKKQGYAFFMESSQIEYEVERNCKLKQVGVRLDNKDYGIAMPLESPYRTTINKVILKLKESGYLTRLKNKWWKEKLGGGKCDSAEVTTTSSDALRLANVGGVFVVLGVGVTIALAFSLVEFLWNVRKVAIQGRISYYEALKIEIKFAVNVWVTEKRSNMSTISQHPSKHGSETGSNENVLQEENSLLQLEIFDKMSANRKL